MIRKYSSETWVAVARAYKDAHKRNVGSTEAVQDLAAKLHMTYTKARYLVNYLLSMDRKVRSGRRPRKGIWQEIPALRAEFPLPRFRAMTKRRHTKRGLRGPYKKRAPLSGSPLRPGAPTFERPVMPKLADVPTELLMTPVDGKPGRVQLQITTNVNMANALLATIANGKEQKRA